MKNKQTITIVAAFAGAAVGSYYLKKKLDPPSLIIEKKDGPNMRATINFDGTTVVATTAKAVEVPGRNGYVLKAFPKDNKTIKLDLWKNGKKAIDRGRITFA